MDTTLLFSFAAILLVTAEGAFISTAPSSAPASAPAPNIVYDAAVCPELCIARCAKSSRPNLCQRACGSCCERCLCVPAGTYGNRETCGKCYTDMTTYGGKPKCP